MMQEWAVVSTAAYDVVGTFHGISIDSYNHDM